MKQTTKQFDFESAQDLVSMSRIFEQRARAIDEEILKLQRSPDRYSNPEIGAQIDTLRAEQSERQNVYDAHREALRTSWLGDGWGEFSGKLAAEEKELDTQILDLLHQVWELVGKRAILAATRDASTKQYGKWLISSGQQTQGQFYRQLDTTILEKKIHVAPGGGQETSRDILNVYLAQAFN